MCLWQKSGIIHRSRGIRPGVQAGHPWALSGYPLKSEKSKINQQTGDLNIIYIYISKRYHSRYQQNGNLTLTTQQNNRMASLNT
jgi:hypothetical protein